MASVNKVILIGNLTRDPEVRFTPKGSAVCDVGMALNRTFVQDEKKVEETTFVEVIVWGKQAEVVGQYCKKGRPLYIEGRLQMDSWEDKQSGEKRSKLRIVAENIQLLGGAERNEESQQPSSGRSERQSSAPSTVTAGALPHEDEDDIPF